MSARFRRAAVLGATMLAPLFASALLGTTPALASPAQAPPPTAAAAPSPQQTSPTERAAAEARPAVVYLQQTFRGYVADETGTFFNNGNAYEVTTTCTGFGVNPNGYVATAGHCVDTTSPNGVKAVFIGSVAAEVAKVLPDVSVEELTAFGLSNWTVEGQQADSPIDSSISVVRGGGTDTSALPARVVDVRPLDQGDVALLKVETTDLPTVELAADAQVQVGTPVLSIGYPASAGAVTDAALEPSNKDGQVSSKRTVGTVPVYETSAALTDGMSGGPSIGLDGRVLGINSFSPAGESQAFNFIAPAAGLTEVMARNGVANELGTNDRIYRQALSDYYDGRYTSAIAGFDRLLALAPQHEQAAQVKTLAAKAREQFGDAPTGPALFGSSTLLWIVAGGGVLLVAGAAALTVVLVRRRRNGAGPEAQSVIPNVVPPSGVPAGMAPTAPMPPGILPVQLTHAADQQAEPDPQNGRTGELQPH